MIGAIFGDVVGSVYEFNNIKTKEFNLFHPRCHFTDDTVMTISLGGDSDTLCAICGAVAEAYYGMTDVEREKALSYLDSSLLRVVKDFTE